MALKARHITTCRQLLAAAAEFDDRERLSRDSRIPLELLSTIVRRADMARIEGIGAVFGLMLEELDVLEVSMLAKHDPQALHDRLGAHNQSERLARRSPTPEEVTDWIEQARSLPILVTGYPQASAVGTAPQSSVAP